jgi:hypothetical protein
MKSGENCFTALFSLRQFFITERYLETCLIGFHFVAHTKLGTFNTFFNLKS